MITDQDSEWLASTYPGVSAKADTVAGVIEFAATYNGQTHQFLCLDNGAPDTVGGQRLSGRFDIRIQERVDKSVSALPALHVEGVDPTPDRHFNQTDKSACLCSPLEEQDFLAPHFDFRRYFEQLIVPFLYGQVFYSAEGRWPWFEYGHGAVGLLESYSRELERPARRRNVFSGLPGITMLGRGLGAR